VSKTPISRYTVLMSVTMALAISFIAAVVLLGLGGETVGLWVADVGSVLVTGLAAAIVIRTALQYQPGEPYRRYWMLIGIGVAVYSIGDLVWAAYELTGNDVPYPGAPDLFYFAEYAFLGTALLTAALAYRGLVDLKKPLAITGVVTAGAAIALWLGFLGPVVFADPELSTAERAVSVAYPLFDVFFAFAPALLLLLVISALGGGRLAWPWWPVVIGTVVLAASDTGYALAETLGGYVTGGIIEYGWMAAHGLLAVGALIARDVTGTFSR